ncbi:sensor domain-containing diguanylate cyclase [Dasania marina]|uniref:sensor domain-containing diguanylate cyclase n=1 Tax=Dasania marina TaxID=471499 RepID=UPI000374C783|nr:sensor domain-containing diguanylate cyclase [Dasania marina]
MRFDYRIVFIITGLLFTLSTSLTVVNYFVSVENIRSQLKDSSLPLTVDNIYTVIQKQIIEPNLISSMMANDTFMKDWLSHEEGETDKIARYLDTIQNKYKMSTTFLVSEKTMNYYTAKGLIEKIKSDNPNNAWYFDFKNIPEVNEINIDHNEFMGTSLFMFINHKIFDEDFHLLGVIGVGLKTSYIDDMLKRFRQDYKFNVYFVDDVGQLIISEKRENSPSYLDKMPDLKQLGLSFVSNGSQIYEYTKNNDMYLLNRKYIPELDLYLIVEAKIDDFTSKLEETFYFNIAVTLLLTLIITIIVLVYVRKMHRRLNDLANNDVLTGLPNRRTFNDKLEYFLLLIKRNKSPLSIVFLDVDNFKNINDSKGHDVGDKVLKKLAKLLNATVRSSDFVARWGGEEFIIMLADTNVDNASLIAEKLRSVIESCESLQSLVDFPVTASFGVTSIKNDDHIDDIFKRVDSALYQAKSEGKNRVIKA